MRHPGSGGVGRLAALAFVLGAFPAQEVLSADFTIGSFTGDFSSTFNYGIAARVGDPDPRLTNATNAGNLNFDSGDIILNRFTGIHDLGFKWGRFDGLIRGSYFYDQANDSIDLAAFDPIFGPVTGGDPNGRRPKERSVLDFRLLDAYVATNIGPVTARLGRQVISWGESTFIAGSLNEINTVDVSNLRTPGAQLKEGLLPSTAARIQWPISSAMSFDAFYLFEFDRVQIDPAGVFWDAATFLADGGTRLGPFLRAEDREAPDSGQYGASMQFFAPELGKGWDFGVYWMNVHSHAPYVGLEDRDLSGRVSPADRYFVAYPDDVEIWGVSFNTLLGPWAWSGEWSHRRNLPILLNFGRGAVIPDQGNVLRGWDRIEVDQIQMTFNYALVPRLIGANRATILAEVAYQTVGSKPALQTFQPITDSSWKYQVSLAAEYLKVIGDMVNLTPRIALAHDVRGISPEASPIYIDGRKVATVGVDWSYLVNWSGGISLTRSFGADRRRNNNGGMSWAAADRSWVSMNFSYQF